MNIAKIIILITSIFNLNSCNTKIGKSNTLLFLYTMKDGIYISQKKVVKYENFDGTKYDVSSNSDVDSVYLLFQKQSLNDSIFIIATKAIESLNKLPANETLLFVNYKIYKSSDNKNCDLLYNSILPPHKDSFILNDVSIQNFKLSYFTIYDEKRIMRYDSLFFNKIDNNKVNVSLFNFYAYNKKSINLVNKKSIKLTTYNALQIFTDSSSYTFNPSSSYILAEEIYKVSEIRKISAKRTGYILIYADYNKKKLGVDDCFEDYDKYFWIKREDIIYFKNDH